MSPRKLHDDHNQSIINGPRPSPLNIKKASHLIQKQSSSSSSSSCSSLSNNEAKQQQKMQRNNPVIIYTHSPKIIHTQARDFMALVQKLTGLSRSRNDETTQHRQATGVVVPNKGSKSMRENSDGSDVNSPILKPPKNPYFGDIPLFTPTSVDYFCSPKPVYRYSDSSSSPSIMEFIKGLPEY